MKIYVDADACPVISIVEQLAKENNIEVTLLCDTNHVLDSDYSEVKIIGAGADAVDCNSGLWCCGEGSWKRRLCDTSVG